MRKNGFNLFAILFIYFHVGISFNAIAADVRPHINGSLRNIIIEGNIEPGDYDMFMDIVKENQGLISGVYIFSPGGDFNEAIKIGEAIRALELTTSAPLLGKKGTPICGDVPGVGKGILPKPRNAENCTCASAGFFIYLGGIYRTGHYLLVHRPYYDKSKFGNLSESQAKAAFDSLQKRAKRYMNKMEVPEHIQEDILRTPSDKALRLDKETINRYFAKALPYKHEWLLSKCPKLTPSERKEMSKYFAKVIASIGTDNQPTADETKRNKELKEKGQCALKIQRKNRIEAYEKVFKEKINDYQYHNFNVWVNAPEYIGRRFYEILDAENYKEEGSSSISFLKKEMTAKTPYILLSDASWSPRVVRSVSVIGSSNPSKEFIRLLVDSLEESWGPSTRNKELKTWVWKVKKYKAELKYEPVSANGPYMLLEVE